MVSIEAVFRQAIDAAAGGDRDARVTLEASNDPAKWVQLAYDTINAAYPLGEDPTHALAALSVTLPEYVEVSEWQAHQFVTFEHGAEPLPALVRFVQEYIVNVLDIPAPETTLRVAHES